MAKNEIIQSLLGRLFEDLKRLEEAKKVSADDFIDNTDLQAIVERKLQVAIQICIDIANRIIALKKLPPPESYGESFLILNKAGIIPADFANSLTSMVSFRNILVHGYLKVNPRRVHKILEDNLKDFYDFANYVNKLLMNEKD